MIEVKDLQKVVAGVNVLEVKRLSVSAGEAAAVIGPPGSGKSELLSLLIGRSRPTSGMVSIAGHDPSAEKERLSEKMGVLFAENGLYERMSAQANLAFYCKLRGLPGARAEDVLVQVGLADHAAVHAGRLAPGLARRLAFGRAILHNPSILLLVNPFAGCDSASCSLLSRLVNRLAVAGAAYGEGNVAAAILVTFLVNLLLGSVAVLTLPSLIVPFSGLLVGFYRALLWGLLLSPVEPELTLPMIPHSITLLLEGQAYIIVLLAAYVQGKSLLFPRTAGVESHWRGYVEGFKRQGLLYVLVILVLAVAAVYEALTVIYLIPLL